MRAGMGPRADGRGDRLTPAGETAEENGRGGGDQAVRGQVSRGLQLQSPMDNPLLQL